MVAITQHQLSIPFMQPQSARRSDSSLNPRASATGNAGASAPRLGRTLCLADAADRDHCLLLVCGAGLLALSALLAVTGPMLNAGPAQIAAAFDLPVAGGWAVLLLASTLGFGFFLYGSRGLLGLQGAQVPAGLIAEFTPAGSLRILARHDLDPQEAVTEPGGARTVTFRSPRALDRLVPVVRADADVFWRLVHHGGAHTLHLCPSHPDRPLALSVEFVPTGPALPAGADRLVGFAGAMTRPALLEAAAIA